MWNDFIALEKEKDYFKKINEVLKKDEFYPDKENIFKAFELCPYDKVKVVILGQDPYHEEGQAHGLAFSVLNNKAPKSLINIFKEIESDTSHKRTNPNLSDWASQGVLLLNTVLTVKCHEANSHKMIGWEIFTDNVIKELNKKENSIVFILWGKSAESKEKLINSHHYIIKTSHPSPLSCNRGFFGSKVFSKTNEYLIKNNEKEIKWWD